MSVTFPFFSLDRSPSDRSRDAAQGTRLLTLALVLIGSVAGCATKADVRDLQDEIRELYSQQQVLLREAAGVTARSPGFDFGGGTEPPGWSGRDPPVGWRASKISSLPSRS